MTECCGELEGPLSIEALIAIQEVAKALGADQDLKKAYLHANRYYMDRSNVPGSNCS